VNTCKMLKTVPSSWRYSMNIKCHYYSNTSSSIWNSNDVALGMGSNG
jgi:hypothetical protein